MLARHLITRGHTRIAGIFKSDDIQGHQRYLGFLSAMRDAVGLYRSALHTIQQKAGGQAAHPVCLVEQRSDPHGTQVAVIAAPCEHHLWGVMFAAAFRYNLSAMSQTVFV